MRTRLVHVSPTQANIEVVRKLIGMPPLDEVTFRLINAEKPQRTRHLERLGAGAVYMWGDGYAHDESYYFGKRKVRLKVNIDNHPDNWKRREDDDVDCVNHMSATQQLGIDVVTPAGGLCPIDQRTKLFGDIERALETAEPGTVHLTIDFDAVTGFPARDVWICRDGISISGLAAMTRRMNGHLGFLDVGGLNETIPDFEFVETNGFVPDVLTSDRVVNKRETDQGIVNKVLSYATRAYYEVLTAALFSN